MRKVIVTCERCGIESETKVAVAVCQRPHRDPTDNKMITIPMSWNLLVIAATGGAEPKQIEICPGCFAGFLEFMRNPPAAKVEETAS